MGYSHIIWDMNGTLVDDAHLCVKAINPLLLERGLSPIDLDDYRKNFRFPVRDYYRNLGFRLTPEEFDDVAKRFHDGYHSILSEADLFPETAELIHKLLESGKTLSVLSAARQDDLEHVLEFFDLKKCFHHLYGLSDRLAASKIDRGRELMSRVGTAPEQCILIGDTDHDLEVGAALGIAVILVSGGHQCHTVLEKSQADIVRRKTISRE